MNGLKIAAAAAAFALTATASGANPAASGTVAASDAQAFVTFFDRFVGIVDSNQDDCAAMARKLEALLAANADMLARGRAAAAAGQQLPAAARQHVNETAKKLGAGAQRCGANPQVAHALQQLQTR